MTNNSASYVDNAATQAKIRANTQGVNKTAIIPATNLNDAANTARLAKIEKQLALAEKDNAATSVTTKSSAATQGTPDPKDYIWNLPPHDWSLPVIPETMNPFDGTLTANSRRNRTPSFHQYRRGRLWFWCGVDDINAIADDGTVTTFGAVADGAACCCILNSWAFGSIYRSVAIEIALANSIVGFLLIYLAVLSLMA